MQVSYPDIVKVFPAIQNELCNRTYCVSIQVKLFELLITLNLVRGAICAVGFMSNLLYVAICFKC